MTAFEVYAYWNTTELVNVFNAVAAITGSGDFAGLLRTIALVMVITLAITALAGKTKQEDFWRWVFLLAIFHGLLLVPKVNVRIVDRTSSNPPQVVSNVPIGLAALAHSTSKIGDWLTTTFETTFSQPDDVQLRKTGTLFGHRVMLERIGTEFASPILMRNLDEFYRECVMPDIATGYIDSNAVATADDVWALFSNTNPGVLVTISDYNTTGISNTYSCPNAYNTLTQQMNLDTNKIWERKAQTVFPNLPLVTAKAALSGAMTTTPQFYAPSASMTSVSDQLKQGALCNYIIDAPARIGAQMGDAAQVQQAHAQASSIRAYKANTQTAYNLAMSTMPKFRNAVEMMLYALFPIIILIVIVAGSSAGTVLKAYIGGLLWVQLWAPLYAILNYMMNLKTAESVGSMVAATGNAYYACGATSWLGSTVVNDMDVAAYFAISIPVIAWMLVQGSMSAMGGMIASSASSAASTGSTELQGFMRRDQTSVGQHNAAPTLSTGAPQTQHRDSSGAILTSNALGPERIAAGASIDQTGFDAKLGSRVSAGAVRQSEDALAASRNEATSAMISTGAALQRGMDFARRSSHETGNTNRWGTGSDTEVVNAANTATRLQDTHQKSHGYNEKMSAAVNATAAALAQTPGALEMVSPARFKAELKAQLGSETAADEALKHAVDLASNQEYARSVRTVAKATESKEFSDAEKGSTGAGTTIQALATEGRQHMEQASAQLQASKTYKQIATEATEASADTSQSLLTRVMDRLGRENVTIDGHTHQGMSRADINRLMTANNQDMRAAFERVANEEAAAYIQQRSANIQGPADVTALHEANKGTIPTAGDVKAQGDAWKAGVAATAANAGVAPTGAVADKNNLKQQVTKQQYANALDIAGTQSQVDGRGAVVKGAVNEKTEQPVSLGGMLGNSAGNAFAGVMPSGSSFLITEGLGWIGKKSGVDLTPTSSFLQRNSDHYEANGGTVAGAFFDTALVAAGPVAGKVAGPVIGKLMHPGAPARAAANVMADAGAAGQAFPGLTSIVAREAAEETAAMATRSGTVAGVIGGTLAAGPAIDASGAGPRADAAIGGAVAYGQSATSDLFSGSNGSGLGGWLGGGQHPAPAPAQPAGTGAPANNGDTPGPGGR